MNRWISVLVVVVSPLLWQCSEKKEMVTSTESSTTMGQATNPSEVPVASEPFPTVTETQPAPVPMTAPPAGPPLRNPAAAAPAADPTANARRIDLRDAERLISSGEAFVVDVRSEADFARSHIRGAVNIPVAQVQFRASELPRDKMIITYCT